jgi:hypothetical protein
MALNNRPIKRLRVYEEANGSFATDHSGTLGDYLDVPFIQDTCEYELLRPKQSPMHYLQHIDDYSEEVFLPKEATLKFAVNLQTVDTKPGSGVAIAQGALGRLLKIAMGGESLGTGRTVTTGATTTVVPASSISGMPVGNAVGFNTGASGRLEIREIKNNASTQLTLKHALTGAPANSAALLPSATYYLGGTSGDQTTSLQAIIEGASTQDRYLLLGGWLESIAFEQLAPGSIPRVTLGWRFAQWFRANGSDTAANLTTAALERVSYVNAKTLVVQASEFRKHVNGTSTIGPLIHAPAIEYVPNIVYETQRAPGGTNTVVQAVRVATGAPAISGSFQVPAEDQTWINHELGTDEDADNVSLDYQIGSSITRGGAMLVAPTVQITSVQPIGIGRIEGWNVSWKGRLDGDTVTSGLTGTNLDRALSAFRVHLI